MDLTLTVAIITGITTFLAALIFIYLINTVDPSGPNSRDKDGYKKMITLFCQQTINKKQLVPTLVHDDFSRLLISICGIVIVSYAFIKIMDYFNDQ